MTGSQTFSLHSVPEVQDYLYVIHGGDTIVTIYCIKPTPCSAGEIGIFSFKTLPLMMGEFIQKKNERLKLNPY